MALPNSGAVSSIAEISLVPRPLPSAREKGLVKNDYGAVEVQIAYVLPHFDTSCACDMHAISLSRRAQRRLYVEIMS